MCLCITCIIILCVLCQICMFVYSCVISYTELALLEEQAEEEEQDNPEGIHDYHMHASIATNHISSQFITLALFNS